MDDVSRRFDVYDPHYSFCTVIRPVVVAPHLGATLRLGVRIWMQRWVGEQAPEKTVRNLGHFGGGRRCTRYIGFRRELMESCEKS